MPDLASVLAAYKDRVAIRRPGDVEGKCVVYWMQRAQRAHDNPALDLAVDLANALQLPVVVFFGVVHYPKANLRHYAFMQQGFPDTARRLASRNIAFVLRRHPHSDLAVFCDEVHAALLVGDENPLREALHWREMLARKLRIPYYTVDADVLVPSKLLLKAQYAARTIRPRLEALAENYLVPCRNPHAEKAFTQPVESCDLSHDITAGWDTLDRTVAPVSSFTGGTNEALRRLDDFVTHHLAQYPGLQGAPERDGTSHISPYLHFGQISPVTIALAVRASKAPEEAKEKYLDELITWRELAINFVTFNPLYDSIECAEPWAHKSLAAHASDPRPILYTRPQLEQSQTHDQLWNAAQFQMLHLGWMHNYMRMYWAKKILEWSPSPQSAYQTAVYLNDKYFLDGRDPSGYAGVAWSIAGKFDRPWFDRPIFGVIRYMSANAAAKKFDSAKYIRDMYVLANRPL
ncbi:MAG TPA: deoxyribodipyrimidine photo-lyase [Candidatus Saccharimonadales bacterium]|nr:deoxyribodipyrimidine photo-lyase [Candidatus Saccharimonadales bacterium]